MPLRRRSKKQSFKKHMDSFVLTDANHSATLCRWVNQQSAAGNAVVVLSHFPSTFLSSQDSLQQAGIDFEILANRCNEIEFLTHFFSPDSSSPDSQSSVMGSITLTMAQMLVPSSEQTRITVTNQPANTTPPRGISVIVTERYPMAANDERLAQFFSQVEAKISMGYLISFENPLLHRLLGKNFIDLLKQLGLGDNDLISSVMTDRQLARRMAKATASITDEQQAESPEHWIRLNLDEDRES